MTNNIKYQRPLPIKAQKGRVLTRIDNSEEAKKENARRRAKSEEYFDKPFSIPNLAKGIYYWATSEPILFGEKEDPYLFTGTAPAVGAVAGAAGAARRVGQFLPGLAFLSSQLGGRSGQTAAPTISRARLMDRAETAAADTTATAPADTTGTAGPTPPPTNPQNNNNNNNKKESGFKKGAKETVQNIGRWYGKGLQGSAYVIGMGGPLSLGGWGIYSALKSAPTAADSLLDQQSKQLIELGKLNQAKQNQAEIDRLRQQLMTGSTQPTVQDTAARARAIAAPVTTSTQHELDSLNNLWHDQIQ